MRLGTAPVPLGRRDWLFIAICVVMTVASLAVIARYFADAFPEASISFDYDRDESRAVAVEVLREQALDVSGMKHAAIFESDDIARIYLERTLGMDSATDVMRDDVLVWYWRHRWFKPLQEEEYAVEVAPTGELVSFARNLPESMAMPPTEEAVARAAAEAFLMRAGIDRGAIDLVSQSERKLPARVQRIFTWESKSIRPGGAPYRYVATVDGGAVSSFARRLRVPEEWLRSYRELRSRNESAGRIDIIFMLVVMIAALATFIARIRRGDLQLRFLLTIGAVTAVLVTGVTANSFPSALAGYDTTTSYPAFLAQLLVVTIVQAIGSAMLLVLICGAGEVLYRQHLPQHLAIPRLWTWRALASKRVFESLVLGYSLVGFFIAYQVAFYVIAAKFGAWAPADIPYDDILNTAFPWIAVLFAGFFPAFSEEFLSRAFSIPFFERLFRSRLFAIVLAGFIWGFGHVAYPQQPFYIRGLEVGLAGVILGLLMYRHGLLALLIWHYTVDAVYTSLLLFRSGNTYYITSAALAALVFAFPLVASVLLYIRNGGFLPDEELSNAALPTPLPEPPPIESPEIPLPAAVRVTPARVALAAALVALAAILIALRPAGPEKLVNYRIDAGTAKAIARDHLRAAAQPLPEKTAVIPVSGFRSWDDGSSREEGGAPGGFDDVAATHMLRSGLSLEELAEVMRTDIHAATWMVRLFTPETKTEYFVEVDPRAATVSGYHKYADERAPGASLEREEALAIARVAFQRYGLDAGRFDLREALSFQQPSRRDWLFHFDENTKIVDDAVRRVSVRVMGDEITEFVSTIRVPDSVYRDASQQTLWSIALLILKITGIIAGLGLVIAGAIMATRHGSVAWRRAVRLTAMLAIIPIAGAAARADQFLFSYSTTTAWETFGLNVVTDVVRSAGLQILVLFLALAGILSIHGHIARLLSAESRARAGRAAAVAAVTAIAAMAVIAELNRQLEHAFPARMRVGEMAIPGAIATAVPSLIEASEAVVAAIVFSGLVTLFATAVAAWKRRSHALAASAVIIFCVSIDTSAGPRELAMMLITTAIFTAGAWLIAYRVLGTNVLAWPAMVFTGSLLQSGAVLLQNDRSGLMVHGVILVIVAVMALIWLALPRPQDTV